MNKYIYYFSFLFLLSVGCQNLADEELLTGSSIPTVTQSTMVEPPTNKPTAFPTAVMVITPETPISSTIEPELTVTYPATLSYTSLNEQISVQIPSEWIDLNEQIPNWRFDYFPGDLIYWSANNEQINRLLTGSLPLDKDRFVTLFQLNQPTQDPMEELEQWVNGMVDESTIVYNRVTPIQIAAEISGAYIDFSTGNGDEERLLMRALWLPGGKSNRSWMIVVGGDFNNKDQLFSFFNQFTHSIRMSQPTQVETEFTIQVGEIITSELNQTTIDWGFIGEKGKFVTIVATPLDQESDLIISIVDQNGKILATVDDAYQGEAELLPDLFLIKSGVYTIRVQTNTQLPMLYRLQLIETNELQYGGGGRMEIGDEIKASLPAKEKHHWHFLGEVGTVVTIILDPADGLDMVLTFLGADDRELFVLDEGFSGDAELIVGYELPVTGDYEIIISGFNNQAGEYELSLMEGNEQTGSMFDAGNIQVGEIKNQHLFEHEAHIWFFSANEGDRIAIELLPAIAGDVELWLLNDSAQPLITRDEKGNGKLEKIGATLPYTGQYLILIREYAGKETDYQLHLKLLP